MTRPTVNPLPYRPVSFCMSGIVLSEICVPGLFLSPSTPYFVEPLGNLGDLKSYHTRLSSLVPSNRIADLDTRSAGIWSNYLHHNRRERRKSYNDPFADPSL
ncbi:uncharacterized protein RAG0_10992 [Rhynchosporium agropyri]|uniref:Uncharacterized protein n=1 Tax=Rhynchosporium agropyri TaxID=914238 RepID=A0A1E1L251_9HELO|nr:uncharacterized protein RAG0_10992 [Rhynchosporium agropyri]